MPRSNRISAIVFVCLLIGLFPLHAAPIRADAIVAADGSGNCATVQDAIDAAPARAGAASPWVILIKPGIYNARVHVQRDKRFISLIGEDAAKTILTFNLNANVKDDAGKPIGTFATATAFIDADDFTAENLTFENSAGNVGQALAIRIDGDRAVFRHCRFLGWQDTILGNRGRHYFKDCYIAGAVDFIFGAATEFYRNCHIHCMGSGYITAASTPENQPYGFVFSHCTITAESPEVKTYLGRPWRAFGSVALIDTEMANVVRPAGWDNWKQPEREATARFTEFGSTGPGADSKSRVAWARLLSAAEASELTVDKVLGGTDGFNPVPLPDWPKLAAVGPATFPSLSIHQPVIPKAVFRITDYGAKGDGTTLNTDAIRMAIEAASKAGGGSVIVPAGRFLTGPLTLASHLNLRLENDAVLLFSNAIELFPLHNGRYDNCISAEGCTDVAITGPGTLDGQGQPWWDKYRKRKGPKDEKPVPPAGLPHRPHLIVLNHCTRVHIEGVSLLNSPMFHLVPDQCDDVVIEGIRIVAPPDAPNTDGIDPSGRNFLIRRCSFDNGDDCIAIKPSGTFKADHPSCENFLIFDCTFKHGHGLSIGGQTPGGLRGLLVRGCTFEDMPAGIRLKANRGSGGVVEDLMYENLTMKNVKIPILITSYYPTIPKEPSRDPAQPLTAATPVWRNIQILNLTAERASIAGRILGLPEAPVSGVTLTNVRISAEKGMELSHAKKIVFENAHFRAASGAAVTGHDAQVEGIDLVKGE